MNGAAKAPLTLRFELHPKITCGLIEKEAPGVLTVTHVAGDRRSTITFLLTSEDAALEFTHALKHKLIDQAKNGWLGFFKNKTAYVAALNDCLRKLSEYIKPDDLRSKSFFSTLMMLLTKYCTPHLEAPKPEHAVLIDVLVALAFETCANDCLQLPTENISVEVVKKMVLTAIFGHLTATTAEDSTSTAASAAAPRQRAPSLPCLTECDETEEAAEKTCTLRSLSTASGGDGFEIHGGVPARLLPAAAAAAAATATVA